jgi:hypothetical protein
MEKNRELSSYSDHSPFATALPSDRGSLQSPSAKVSVSASESEDVLRTVYEQLSQVGVAGLRDPKLGRVVARFSLAWYQSQIGAYLSALAEASRVAN